MSVANDQYGREVLERVWPATLGEVPTDAELQMVQAVSLGEGGYGLASYKLLDIAPGPNYGAVLSTTGATHNWGATQAGKPPCDPTTSFMATDSDPDGHTTDNPKGYYNICFRRNATGDLGAASYLKILLVGSKSHPRQSVRRAVATGSADEVAAAMHASGYFQGFGATVQDRIDNYADGIESRAQSIAQNLGEPMLVMRGPAGTRVNVLGLFAFVVGAGLLWKGTRG